MAFIDFKKAYDFVFRDGLFFKLLGSGVSGRMFKVLHSMYQGVQSVMKLKRVHVVEMSFLMSLHACTFCWG